MTSIGMRSIIAIIFFALLPTLAKPQRVIYEKEDSARIEEILHCIKNRKPATTGELLTVIAHEFVGEKYVGGTLEQSPEEPLLVSCTKLDCTTFVELVLAIAKSADEGNSNFESVCRNLETIRYRGGRNNGYASRLHYISWWIADSAKKDIVAEITPQMSNEKQLLNLNFMSRHPGNYPLLNDNAVLTAEISQYEAAWHGVETAYIPKRVLRTDGLIDINEGDIIAITTAIEGLDVTHIGFAHYNNGALHLLHASSEIGMVIVDSRPLCDYLAGKKNHTGIRVFRAMF